MRLSCTILIAAAVSGCSHSTPAPHVKISQFTASDKTIPRGLKDKLCYTVENAAKLEMTPKVDDVWPGPPRCVEVSPSEKTTYTLTAYGEDGSRDSKSVDVNVGPPPPKILDLKVS